MIVGPPGSLVMETRHATLPGLRLRGTLQWQTPTQKLRTERENAVGCRSDL